MIKDKKFIFSVAAWFLATAVMLAQPLPLERSIWEKVNPLGGEFENGHYTILHEEAPAFEVACDFPVCSNLVMEADFTPERKVDGDGNSAIAIMEKPGRYWHLFLADNGRGIRRCGMTELGGASQIQAGLAMTIDEGGAYEWQYGRKYHLRLALGGGVVDGEIRDTLTGERIFRRCYILAPGHIASGRPAFKINRVMGNFERIECSREQLEATGSNWEQTGSSLEQTGGPFYRTTRDTSGKWWFVAPDGSRFFLSGIGVVNHNGHYSAALGYAPYARTVARKYPALEDWATNTLARLRSWGFNFLSSPSANLLRRGFPHAHVVNMGQNFSLYGDEFNILPCDGGPCTGFPNVFHPLWPEWCRFRATSVCSHDRDDQWTLGWYIDNELSWWGDKRQFKTPPESGLFDAAARKNESHPAKQALRAFLDEQLAQSTQMDINAEAQRRSASQSVEESTPRVFSRASQTSREDDSAALRLCVEKDDLLSVPVSVKREFVRLCARKYFEATTAAIREADPNHLILGCRFAGLPSADPVVWEECGRYCDAVSVNIYPMADLDRGVAVDWPGPKARLISDIIGERARMAGKPVIVTEWCFSALDSGLPCTNGAGQRFFTQKERAEATSIFARTMWAMPEVGGYVYFMWCDQPAVGKNGPRSENTNYGLVNADDEPYEEQVAALAALQLHPVEARAAEVPQPRTLKPPTAGEFLSRGKLFPRCENQLTIGLQDGRFLIGKEGIFSTMLREYSSGIVSWTVAKEANASGWTAVENGNSGLETQLATFRGEAASGGFETTLRFYKPKGANLFVAELISVKNTGAKPLPFESFFFRVMPIDRNGVEAARGDDVFEPPKAGQPTPIPPMLWRPWRSAAWVLPDGTVLGLLSPRLTGVQIHFWKDPSFHADAEYHFPRLELAPDETWSPQYKPFVIGSVVTGGETGWRAFCRAIRENDAQKAAF